LSKILYTLISIPLSTLCYATPTIKSDCSIKVDSVKHIDGKLKFSISYEKGCEVSMDTNTSQIIIKSYHPTKDSNNTLSNTITDDKKIEELISLAKSKIGNSYLYAAKGPDHFDCSGFVYYLYGQSDIKIPRTSLDQSKSGEQLTREKIKRGDMLFFDTANRGHVNHSGVYLGDGKFIHSSSGKAHGVTISDLDHGFYKEKFRWGIKKF